MVAILVGGNGL